MQLINYRRDQEWYWVDVETRPIRNEAGQVEHFIMTLKDITEQRKQTELLESAKQAAESWLAIWRPAADNCVWPPMRAVYRCGTGTWPATILDQQSVDSCCQRTVDP